MRELFLVTACVFAALLNAAAQSLSDHDLALETVQTFIAANERADIGLMMTTFADDATVFMPGEPAKRVSGSAAIRDAFATLFAARRGPIVITPADTQVQMLGDIAIVTAHPGPAGHLAGDVAPNVRVAQDRRSMADRPSPRVEFVRVTVISR